jgi:hypothetical protein
MVEGWMPASLGVVLCDWLWLEVSRTRIREAPSLVPNSFPKTLQNLKLENTNQSLSLSLLQQWYFIGLG